MAGAKRNAIPTCARQAATRADRQVDVHAQRFHDVGGAALRGHAAIAVLGDAHAGSGDDEGRCGRNIERAAGIAAGAAGIDERVAPGAAGVEHGVGVEFERNGGGADGFGKSDDFFDRLALHVQRHQQRRNLRVRALAGEDLGHHRVGLFAGERLAVNGDAMEGVEDHKIQATAETRLLSNRFRLPQQFRQSLPAMSVCNRKLLRNRSKTHLSAAIAASQMASVAFTTQPGAAPTRRSRNGKKFHVVM